MKNFSIPVKREQTDFKSRNQFEITWSHWNHLKSSEIIVVSHINFLALWIVNKRKIQMSIFDTVSAGFIAKIMVN